MRHRDKWFPNVLKRDGELDTQEVFQSTQLAWESIYSLQADIEGTMEVVGDMIEKERDAQARSAFSPQIGPRSFGGSGGGGLTVLNAERNRLPHLNDALQLDARNSPVYDPATGSLELFGPITIVTDGDPVDAIIIDGTGLESDGQKDSNSIRWTGQSFESNTPHEIDWRWFVDVTSDLGASTFTLETRIDEATYDSRLLISDLGELRIEGPTGSTDAFFFDAGTVIGTTGAGLWIGENSITPSSTNYQLRVVGTNQTRLNAGGSAPSQSIRFSISDVVWGSATNVGQNFWLFNKKAEIRLAEDQIGLLITGHSTQTSNLLEIQDNTFRTLYTVEDSAKTTIIRGTGTVPTETDTGTVLVLQNNLGVNSVSRLALIGGAGGNGVSTIAFGDANDENIGQIAYFHGAGSGGANRMEFTTNTVLAVTIDGSQNVSMVANLTVTGEVTIEEGDATLLAEDIGNDVPGKAVSVGNNENVGAEGGAPGVIELFSADGTPCYIWCKNDGGLAIGTARPTGSTGSPTVPSEIGGTVVSTPSIKSYSFRSPPGGPGTFFVSGFYDFDTDDANLDQGPPAGNTSVTHGNSDVPYAAHAAIIAGGAGTASGGAGTVEIEVSGTSISDLGVRIASDTEILVADVTTLTLDQYVQTVKKWIGPVTFTLQNSGGSTHTAFTADFNFGFARFEDFAANNFFIESWDFVGLAGANDGVFNVELLHHNDQGWTFAATGFVPGGTVLVDYRSDYTPEADLDNTLPFSFQRVDVDTLILAASGEGLIMRITTGSNNSVVFLDLHVAGLFT